MALSRRSVQRMSGSIWPGFVDAMTALLLVLMFVLTIFMIMQFMLSETITGQESELDELASEVNALAQALGLEQQRSFTLEEDVSALGSTLDEAQQQAASQSALIATLTTQIATQSAELDSRAQTISGFETQVENYATQVASFQAQVATLLTQRDQAIDEGEALAQNNSALEAERTRLLSDQEALQLAVAKARDEIDAQTETARLAAARRQALDALIADLRNRSSSSNASLATALAQLETNQDEISGLNSSLASEQDVAAALRARLAGVQQELSENEKIRLADAAAAQILRDRLLQADDELTAMTLALEEQRRDAEEMLTMIAAARSAEGDLTAQLAAALLVGDQLQSQLLDADGESQGVNAQLAKAQETLAAAILARDGLAAQLETSETDRQATASQLASVEDALARSLAAQDGLRGDLQEQVLSGDSLIARLAAVEVALVDMQAERDQLQAVLSTTDSSKTEIADRLAVAEIALVKALAESEALKSGLVDEAELRKQLAAALAEKIAAEQVASTQLTAAEQRSALLSTANTALQEEEAKSADSLRRMAVLNEQISALRGQLGSLQALLEVAEAKDLAANVEITNLSSRLNTALARVLSEERVRADLEAVERERLQAEATQLENYRSEFFGKMRAILGDRDGVSIVGDRFVFSSEVLFEPASADLAADGQVQIARVAEILAEVSSSIPPEIDWVIRIDGHTDNTAMSGAGRYRDNWELSQARALSVVRFMIDELAFPATRLAATGFGEHQPIATGDTPEALAQNRRIELKLTER